MRATTSPVLEATYKGREVEGVLDLLIYRKLGFQLARIFARWKLTPTSVTLLGGLFGIVAGHLYYYRALGINLCGMALHLCANLFDNADGQLARLTNCQSRTGRIVDGVVDHLIFVSIYLHLILRGLNAGASPYLWVLALAAGASHALQSASADYSRNAYLYFGRGTGEFDSSSNLAATYQELRWWHQPVQKFLQWLYLGQTRQQELLAPALHKLVQTVAGRPSVSLSQSYRDLVSPTLKWWRLLMNNTRMLLLFILLFIDKPTWFFWSELTLFNCLLAFLLLQQQIVSQRLRQTASNDALSSG